MGGGQEFSQQQLKDVSVKGLVMTSSLKFDQAPCKRVTEKQAQAHAQPLEHLQADIAAKQQPGKKPVRRVLTSLILQILVFFSVWWNCFYYCLNILVFVYKGDHPWKYLH